MSDVLNAIRQRRSIRKYQTLPVPSEIVFEVLFAAGLAPSAHNSQTWWFIVLNDTLVKDELAQAMVKSWAANQTRDKVHVSVDMCKQRINRFATAPVLILACSTMDGMSEFPDKIRQKLERDLAMQSLGAALQNLLLVTYTKGLGACWFCAPSFCKETVRKILKIPEAVEPEAFIIIGYPAETPLAPKKKLLGEYCFMDVWGGKF